MKNTIKFFSLAIISAATLVSCGEDAYDGPSIDELGDGGTATISFNDAFYGRGADARFEATVPASMSDRQAVIKTEAAANRSYGTANVSGAATSGTGSITIPDVGGELAFDAFGTMEVTFDGVRNGALETDMNGVTTFTPDGSDTDAVTAAPVSVNFYDRVPGVSATGANMLFDWAGAPGLDLDTEVIDAGFTALFESAATGSRYEADVFNNTHPDGDYGFWVTVFDPSGAAVAADIPCRLFVTDPDGTTTLREFVVPAGTASNGRVQFLTFNKATNGAGDIVYTYN